MSSTLRQVLEHFEQSQEAVSLPQMEHILGIERTTLQNMIDYWVRKGKLREVSALNCTTCGSASRCPFVVALPRCYELVSVDSCGTNESVICTCGSCH
jgi:hypothetical protein